MKLKHMVYFVCVSQILLLGINMRPLMTRLNPGVLPTVIWLLLHIPMPAFFFILWKKIAKLPEEPDKFLKACVEAGPQAVTSNASIPILSSLSLILPLVGWCVGWVVGSTLQPHDGSGASWAPVGHFWLIGIAGLSSVIGAVLAACSLWKLERWLILAAIGLALNGALGINDRVFQTIGILPSLFTK